LKHIRKTAGEVRGIKKEIHKTEEIHKECHVLARTNLERAPTRETLKKIKRLCL
jgi:hypothetical protein